MIKNDKEFISWLNKAIINIVKFYLNLYAIESIYHDKHNTNASIQRKIKFSLQKLLAVIQCRKISCLS